MNNRRGFTVLELVIVIGVILILMTLSLTVTSVVLNSMDRRSMNNTFVLLQQAIKEYEYETESDFSFGRIAVPPPVAPLLPDYELQGRDPYGPGTTFPAKFVIYEETSTGTYAICVVLERLISHSSSAEIISKIPGNTFRNVPVTPQDDLIEALPSNWDQIDDVNRMPVGTLPPKWGRIREICDPWNRRIAVIFPGREATSIERNDLSKIDVQDSSVRTQDEHLFGICRNRQICFVSAGPDGEFGRQNGSDTEIEKTYDNIYSYELLPKPAP